MGRLTQRERALLKVITDTEEECRCTLHVACYSFATGSTFLRGAEHVVRTASVIKLPILAHVALCVEEGSLRWDEMLTLTDGEKVGGSGVLAHLGGGLRMSLRDACVLMTILSDNTATNMIIEHLGVDAVNARMASLGITGTTLYRKAMITDTDRTRRYGFGSTTAADMLLLLVMLAERRLGTPDTSDGVLAILRHQQYRDCIPRYLPEDWEYAGKTGSVTGVRNDCGIVTAPDGRMWAMAIFAQDVADRRWNCTNGGKVAVGRVAQAIVGR